MAMGDDFVHVSANATVGDVLQAFVEGKGQWWWLLVAEADGQYSVCSFGSLLPYLTGRTGHIVHNIGDCAICSGINPLLWQETGPLAEEALADAVVLSRRVADLPMAELPVAEAQREGESDREFYRRWPAARAVGVLEDGVLVRVDVDQVKGDLGGLPSF